MSKVICNLEYWFGGYTSDDNQWGSLSSAIDDYSER
jgi:hypothetical protein